MPGKTNIVSLIPPVFDSGSTASIASWISLNGFAEEPSPDVEPPSVSTYHNGPTHLGMPGTGIDSADSKPLPLRASVMDETAK